MSSLLDKDDDHYSNKSVERLLSAAHNNLGQNTEVTDEGDDQLCDIENVHNKNTNKKNADSFIERCQEVENVNRTSVMEETLVKTSVQSLKMLCAGVFKNVSLLKEKLNVKRFDKVKREKPEFRGGSFLAESRKARCSGWMAIVHKPTDRSIVKDELQHQLQSWLHHRLRTFTNMEFKDTENLTVPKLLKCGEEKIIVIHESTIDAGIDSELKHKKLSMTTSVAGTREDCFEKAKVHKGNGVFVEVNTWKKVTDYRKTEKIIETITSSLGLFEDIELREHLDVTEEVLEEEIEETITYEEMQTGTEEMMREEAVKGETAEAASVQNALVGEAVDVKGRNFVPALRQEGRRKEKARQVAGAAHREIEDNEATVEVKANFTSQSNNVC